jgi:hypothetical protein
VRVRKPDGEVIEAPASAAQDFAPEVLREAASRRGTLSCDGSACALVLLPLEGLQTSH